MLGRRELLIFLCQDFLGCHLTIPVSLKNYKATPETVLNGNENLTILCFHALCAPPEYNAASFYHCIIGKDAPLYQGWISKISPSIHYDTPFRYPSCLQKCLSD